MFAQFISEYGTQLIFSIVTAIAGFVGIVMQNLYKKYINTKIKKDVADTVVQGVQQLYKDLRGEEKLEKAMEAAIEILHEKGITISTFELRMLLEAAVAKFKGAFNEVPTVTTTEEEVIENGN